MCSSDLLTMYVDHVGFAAGSTRLIVSSTTGIAEGDTILIGEEVIDANARDLGHNKVVTPGDGLDDQPVGTVIEIEHPPVVALPGVDLISRIALGLTRQRNGKQHGRHHRGAR